MEKDNVIYTQAFTQHIYKYPEQNITHNFLLKMKKMLQLEMI